MMNVLFLDIDGVLNYDKWFDSEEYKKNSNYDSQETFEQTLKSHSWEMSRKHIKMINEIVDKTNCKVVLSSSWRYFGTDNVQTMMDYAGVTFKIHDSIPLHRVEGGDSRGELILSWLNGNDSVENFIIVDDEPNPLEHPKLDGHKVITDFMNGGLLEKDKDYIINYFKED